MRITIKPSTAPAPETAAEPHPQAPGPMDGHYAAIYAAAYGAAFAQQILSGEYVSHQDLRRAAQMARHIAERAVEYYRETE
jgi:hypothetical protein